MRSKPLIALNCSMEEPPGRPYPFLKLDYVAAVERAGGVPVLVPSLARPALVHRIVRSMDAVIFTGSDDIDPACYGQQKDPACGRLVPRRKTRTDLALFSAARARRLPILGICGGLQLVNVALGGTLIQDIAISVPGALRHSSVPRRPPAAHAVRVEPRTLLERLLGPGVCKVNSYHHQAVARLGRGLRVNARASDGLIEGVEGVDGPPLLAVQWHPERMAQKSPKQQKLFAFIVRAARNH